MNLPTVLYLPYNGQGPGQTCVSIAKAMISNEMSISLFLPVARKSIGNHVQAVQALPFSQRFLPYRYVEANAARSVEKRLLETLIEPTQDCRAVYLWPGATMRTVETLKRRGFLLVREMINCHRATAKRILDQVYADWGAPSRHGISEQSAIEETNQLNCMDAIFCPSPMVEKSIEEWNSEGPKILETSYGWDLLRFPRDERPKRRQDSVTVLFVGSIIPRKGAHLLLEIWNRSNIKGTLILAGKMDPLIRERCSDILCRNDVKIMDYVNDVRSLYASADIFAFPTFEEGAPLVTYEAAANGLPVITTPMGSARIIKDGSNGFVCDPLDQATWIERLQVLAGSHALRMRLGLQARLDAREFTWDKVGERRRTLLMTLLGPST